MALLLLETPILEMQKSIRSSQKMFENKFSIYFQEMQHFKRSSYYNIATLTAFSKTEIIPFKRTNSIKCIINCERRYLICNREWISKYNLLYLLFSNHNVNFQDSLIYIKQLIV